MSARESESETMNWDDGGGGVEAVERVKELLRGMVCR